MKESKTDWKQGRVLLPNIKLEIMLPENVLVRDVGEHPFYSRMLRESQEVNGCVESMFSYRMNKWWFTMDYSTNPRNSFEATYIKGHEEGHLCDLTGNLNVLYQEARRLGLNTEHLTWDDVLRSDKRLQRLFENPLAEIQGDKDLEVVAATGLKNPRYVGLTLDEVMAIVYCHGKKSFYEREYPAYIAGLIALTKAGYDKERMKLLEKEINDTTLFFKSKEIPELVEILGVLSK